LTLQFDEAARPEAGGSLQRAFYMSALLLVLGIALTGGYFFWRDTRREVRLATMRSHFVSSVSHELRTPLTSIRMFGEMLLLGRSTNRGVTDEYLQTIVDESERLTRLLDNVLDFSKIEAGRKLYQMRPCSAAEIARSAATTMRYQIAQHGFDLQMQIDEAASHVLGDRDALERALLNLLSNAMKYSGAGRLIRLRVRAESGRVIFAVSDEGIGIPAAEQSRVFEKFYRVNDPQHAFIPGTGLGLTLVSHIVTAHRGEILVQSEVGHGTTFSVVLPAVARDVVATAESQIPA
jgi:signal transduction histidine kinase